MIGFRLTGDRVVLRPPVAADVPRLVAIRRTPEVAEWWGDEPADELTAEFGNQVGALDNTLLVVESEGAVVGAIQWYANDDPQFRHAGMDLFLDPAVRGRGLGPAAVRTLVRHLIDAYAFHRFVIDPSAANAAAIRCYIKVGFRPVGVMREYEALDGRTWRDGLLMDLLAGELIA
jgi:aminoglycoside 6'-N-acetyltransferase